MNTDNPVEKTCETNDNHLRKTMPLASKNIHDFHWRYYIRKCLTLNHISPRYISGGPGFGEKFPSLTAVESLWYYCIHCNNGSILGFFLLTEHDKDYFIVSVFIWVR